MTGEYPPDLGGVADYTATVAQALAAAGDEVHVWTSGASGTTIGAVAVHRVFGSFGARDLGRGSRELDAHPHGGRLLLQWVPHAFGGRGVNLRFPFWLHARSVRRLEPIDVMLHEPFMPFTGSMVRRAAAAAQRVMTATVLRAATRAFVATPAWTEMCRPLAPRVPFRWTPIPSGIPVAASDAAACRRQWDTHEGQELIGCFGRAGAYQEAVLERLGEALVAGEREARLLLIGLGSEALAARLVDRQPALAHVVRATGAMDHARVSAALLACDVMIQPYVAGICARHSSASALLAHARPIASNHGRFTEPVWMPAVKLTASSEPSALVSAAFQLLGDAAERQRLSRAARDLYDACFDVRHTVTALRD